MGMNLTPQKSGKLFITRKCGHRDLIHVLGSPYSGEGLKRVQAAEAEECWRCFAKRGKVVLCGPPGVEVPVRLV